MGLRSWGVKRHRQTMAASLLSLATLVSSSAAGSVRILAPDEAFAPAPAPPERKPSMTLGRVHIASADGQAGRLSALEIRDVPFEVVAPGANPDLVWNPATHIVTAGADVVAYAVDLADLPAIIDRTAAIRSLVQFAAERPLPMRLSDSARPLRGGQQIELDIPDMTRRALVVVDIAGDGTVQLLYPVGADPRVLDTSTYRLEMQLREPYGTDVFLAVSAAQPLDMLEQGLRQLSHYRSAVELAYLVRNAAPADARIGVLSVVSQP